jgi:hypothetical protein
MLILEQSVTFGSTFLSCCFCRKIKRFVSQVAVSLVGPAAARVWSAGGKSEQVAL